MKEFIFLRLEEMSVNGFSLEVRAGAVVVVAVSVVVVTFDEVAPVLALLLGTAVDIFFLAPHYLLTIERAIELTMKVRRNSTKPAAM